MCTGDDKDLDEQGILRCAKVWQATHPAELGALADRLHQVVCDKPGERMSVLAPAVGVTSRELHRCVRQLKDVGRIRSAGQR
ncbi:MAG: hypothetical protein V3V08_04480, partial [Nannocystaceae bacterium]